MSILKNDLLTQLAFSIYQNKGVFALLLGSGLSRSAGIPTGWEITLDLIRRIALAKGEAEQADWAKWYVETTGKDPNYSALIRELGLTPAERRSILDSYIEPTAEDREQGRKIPTKAHLAIAELVRNGYIKVIITTNFDRLMENALREKGVEPTVVSSVDALNGAEPIPHSTCYLLKLHGDYKDTRIRNTETELDSYPKAYNKLLDRIFDEYGLIIAGWSGEWDNALRRAILRASNRRYPTYWTTRSSPSAAAQELIEHRRAEVIPISDADTFFTTLLSRIETLHRTQRQDPLSVELLVNSTKRYVAKPEYRIELDELFADQTGRLIKAVSGPELGGGGSFSTNEFRSRVQLYESATETLARMSGVVGRWGDGQEFSLVLDAIRTLYEHAESVGGGLVDWLRLRSYPASLVYCAYGLALTRSQRWQLLHKLFRAELVRKYGHVHRVVECLYPGGWEGGSRDFWKHLEGSERRKTPLSDHLFELFSDWSTSFSPLTPDFRELYGRFEMLAALAYIERYTDQEIDQTVKNGSIIPMPVGRFEWDHVTLERLLHELKEPTVNRDLLKAGFGRGNEAFIDRFVLNLQRIGDRMMW